VFTANEFYFYKKKLQYFTFYPKLGKPDKTLYDTFRWPVPHKVCQTD